MKGSSYLPLFRVLLLAAVLAEILTSRYFGAGHPYFWFEYFPAFWSLFGLAAGAAIVLLAKGLLGRLVSRGEDYYD